jgi:hypothetical protein
MLKEGLKILKSKNDNKDKNNEVDKFNSSV